ncbi:MAG: Rieske (2Fe-2S) protein [Actinomycetota bacterium]|nr:Rieske (2Fe-2S) protein [Actinomycetota bacterium]
MRIEAGRAEDLVPGDRVSALSGDRKVVVFNIDGHLHAMNASCVHTGGPLEEGVVRDGVVTCPWHLHRYEVTTGQRVDMPGKGQEAYPVAVEDGVIMVEVPDPKPPRSIREQLLEHAREWERDA